VRILAATNINIPEALANKSLREDLYYRLNAFTLFAAAAPRTQGRSAILLKHFMSRMSELYGRPPLPLSPSLMEACLRTPGRESARAQQFCKALFDPGRRKAGRERIESQRRLRHSRCKPGDEEGGLKSLGRNAKDEAEADAIARLSIRTNWNRKQAAPC